MLRKLRPRLTYANVTATLALFFALGGSAVAAFVVSSNSQIGPDTIYGANKPASANDNIVAGSVAGSDLASNSVGGGKVVDDSLSALDLGPNSVGSGELGSGAVTTRTLKDGSVTKAKLAPLGAWSSSPLTFHDCAFTNPDFVNWSSFGSGYADVGVRLDAHSVVHLRGAAACKAPQGTILSDATIATLAAGYRPKAKEVFRVASSDGSGNYVGEAIIEVDSAGNVTLGGSFDSRFISLSGIEFDTLQ